VAAASRAGREAGWDADRYQRQFGYVSAMAGDLLELLGPAPGETVLDLGCGTGELAAAIQARGARVWALDRDPAMVAAARERLGADRVLLADGRSFTLPEPVDAVFSNAALHWMDAPAEVIARVRAALRPGGRFVAELGGAGNIAAILDALGTALAEAGLPEPACPWFFPTVGRYASLLEAGGFRVARMEHFPPADPAGGRPRRPGRLDGHVRRRPRPGDPGGAAAAGAGPDERAGRPGHAPRRPLRGRLLAAAVPGRGRHRGRRGQAR
jgi:SAM-dependent methyltransferase